MQGNPPPLRPLKTLLLDESEKDRAILRSLLLRHPAFSILGECASPGEVATMKAPDVIFVDSSFRTGSLVEICAQLPSQAQLIIVSANRDFAWQAFELDAVDFLLKPVEAKRLAEAVRRLLRLDWGSAIPRPEPSSEVVIIPFERGRRGIALRDICAIQAFGNYSRVLLSDGGSELVLRSLARWQQALPPTTFLRVHRNAIVNRERICGLENNGETESAWLRVEGVAEDLAVSRRQAAALKKLLYAKLP